MGGGGLADRPDVQVGRLSGRPSEAGKKKKKKLARRG